MPRYKLTVAYDGTQFHGWQKQKPTAPAIDDSALTPNASEVPADVPVRTIQGVLEETVSELFREPINLMGASRTDSGVHARGQIAAFNSSREFDLRKLRRAVNARLPEDVQVRKAELVSDTFDPIGDCIAKGYRYRLIHSCRGSLPLFDRHFVTQTGYRLDVGAMNEAARLLLGEHDFASFARISHGRQTTVRTIYECKVVANPHMPRRCHLDIAGNGFLYNMIRIIAGTLMEIGRGKQPPEQMSAILESKSRDAAGPTMPSQGLCLMWVRYA